MGQPHLAPDQVGRDKSLRYVASSIHPLLTLSAAAYPALGVYATRRPGSAGLTRQVNIPASRRGGHPPGLAGNSADGEEP